MTKHTVYLGLGSNMGDRERNLRKAIRLITDRVGQVTRQSSFIETEPWGYESSNRYMNAAVRCETTKTPREVLLLTQQIERDLGRKTKSVSGGYADRTIDIDILLYDDLHIDEPDLKIPHPLMQQRDFVMVPLQEIQMND
jgi:2-amino-4-hydroxy-6-hydroxymethyldihydropteridine diphosphokinase